MHDLDTAADDPTPSPLVAARTSVAAIVGERDVVSVGGADATTFLQGQLSADVAALPEGGSTWSLLLEPQGRLVAWIRVWRSGPDEFRLDVDAGWGEQVVARLQRFLLRVEVTLDLGTWGLVALRGPSATPGAVPRADAATRPVPDGAVPGGMVQNWSVPDGALVAAVDWRGLPGVDLLVPPGSRPGSLVPDDVPVLDAEQAEVLRVEQGWPAMGRELDESVIPGEVGQWFVDGSASFTKGCYTGQELVARIDSRGNNTPRRLRGVLVTEFVDDPAGPPVGAEVAHDGQVRGTLTSVTCSPSLGGLLGLSLTHRSVEEGDAVEVRWSAGSAAGRVVGLPAVDPAGAAGAE